MSRLERKRRLRVVAAVESLEPRQLMHSGPLFLKEAAVALTGTASLGPWGRLKLVDRLEARGDHQFDAMGEHLTVKFDHWALKHPTLARESGLKPTPLGSGNTLITTTQIASSTPPPNLTSSAPAAGSGASPDETNVPLTYAAIDFYSLYKKCPCLDSTANGAMAQAIGAGAVSGGLPSGDASAPASPNPYDPLLNQSGPMESNASVVTGAYLQDHPLVAYQSQGVLNTLDFQYSSLQADPLPVDTVALTTQSGSNSAQITSITASLTVNGNSQGSAVTYNHINLSDGESYLVQVQAAQAGTYPTAVYPDTLTITKYFSGGGSKTETYNDFLMQVNASASPYGAGWSVGGLQQIVLAGSSTDTLMVMSGNADPEEFTSSNGVNFTGDASDASTLNYNSTTGGWTRTYPDGSVVQFNGSGQETSVADRNGNTTTYAYVTSGPATGALASVTDPVGLVTTLNYNSSGQLSSVVDPAGRTTTFTINSSGNLTSITDPNSATTSYGYNSSHEITTETNPVGQTASVTYDTFGRMSKETLFDGVSTVLVDPSEEKGLLPAGGSGALVLPSGYLGSATNPNGQLVTLGFNSNGGITTQTNGLGGVTTITRDSNNRPIAITNPLGQTTQYAYDSNGNVTQITLADGSIESIAYSDPFGVPTQITDFRGLITTFTLDAHGNILSRTDPDGLSETYTYNSAGQVLTVTDPRGNTTTYTYNTLGDLTAVQEPGSGSPTYNYAYDAAGDVTSVTDPMGNATTYTYDLASRVLTIQNPVQYAAGKATTYAYNGIGEITSITDANGHTTSYAYNAREELTTVTNALGGVTTYGYDAEGNVTSITDPLGNMTSYAYNADNSMTSKTDALGNTTTYGYNNDNQLTSTTSPNGGVTTYTYNAVGELATVTLPGQTASTSYGYDADGNLTSVTDPLGNQTVYAYDNMNRESSMTVYPNGSTAATTTYAYDPNGNLTSVTNALGYVTSYVYDARNELTSQTDPSGGGTTSFVYDLAGRMTSLTDPVGNVTSWTYTTANQVASQTNPMGGVTSYLYDLAGNETSTTDPLGRTTNYAYDANNRLTTETWANPGNTPYNVVTTTYDAAGNVTKISDNYATYTYTYNKDNQVATASDAGSPGLPSVTLTYGYDANSNLTSMADSLGGTVNYAYDARNELTNETLSGTGLSPQAVAFGYDAAGRLTSLARYSNLAETQTVATTTYGYDHANQMTSLVDQNAAGTTLVSYGYTYDLAGRLTQETRTWASGASTDTLSYSYTNNNQLTGVTHTNTAFANESFAYDANGNATGTGFTTAAGNEQTASPGYTYTYDQAGNMLTSTQTSTGDVWTYGYDFRNRLTSAVEKSSSGTVLEQQSFTYDALDNRIETTTNGVSTWTLYVGSSPIMDFTGAGALAVRYLQGPMGVLSRQTASGTVAWYLADQLGTARDLIDNSGNIIDHVDFSAFGVVLAETAPTVGDRMMGFAGLERDSLTGLNLAVMRAQNPGTGRWTTQDPLSFAAGDANLYGYVGNGPVSYSDPNGTYYSPPQGPDGPDGGQQPGRSGGGALGGNPVQKFQPVPKWPGHNGPYSPGQRPAPRRTGPPQPSKAPNGSTPSLHTTPGEPGWYRAPYARTARYYSDGCDRPGPKTGVGTLPPGWHPPMILAN